MNLVQEIRKKPLDKSLRVRKLNKKHVAKIARLANSILSEDNYELTFFNSLKFTEEILSSTKLSLTYNKLIQPANHAILATLGIPKISVQVVINKRSLTRFMYKLKDKSQFQNYITIPSNTRLNNLTFSITIDLPITKKPGYWVCDYMILPENSEHEVKIFHRNNSLIANKQIDDFLYIYSQYYEGNFKNDILSILNNNKFPNVFEEVNITPEYFIPDTV